MTAAPTAGDALALVRLAASGAAGALARHASRIDDINVFPVPDGDTGANLSQTARSVLDALQANSQPEPSAIARVGARAALLGARGNSGIILSQLVRGACDRLGEGGPLDGPAVADALRRASTEADAALREPVEGTILTVARALADGAEAARSQDPIDDARRGARRRRGRARAHDRHAAVPARGGRRGRGRRRARGARARRARRPARRAGRRGRAALGARARRRRRSTTTGRATAPGSWSQGASRASSWSSGSRRWATASSSSATASSCARTSTPTTPARALSAATELGTLSGVEISDMHAQRDALAERAGAPAVALEDDGRLADVLAIVDGDGNRVLYASLGARLLLSGRPTADELLDAIRTSPAAGIVLLPNDPGLQVVADYAAQASPVPVHVVPSRGLAQGLAALVAYRTDQSAAVLAAAFAAAAAWAGSAEVPGGVNDVAALREAVGRALAPGSTLVTVLAGATAEQEALEALADWLRVAHPGVELELHAGGQAHPRYSVSAE